MGRGSREPFNANPDSGRTGFRDPELDPMEDGRPVLVRAQFWDSEEQRLAYERAAREIQPAAHFFAPKGDDAPRAGQRTWLGMQRLCEEIAQMAEGLTGGRIKRMPRRGISQREWQERAWQVKKAGGHSHFEEPVE